MDTTNDGSAPNNKTIGEEQCEKDKKDLIFLRENFNQFSERLFENYAQQFYR